MFSALCATQRLPAPAFTAQRSSSGSRPAGRRLLLVAAVEQRRRQAGSGGGSAPATAAAASVAAALASGLGLSPAAVAATLAADPQATAAAQSVADLAALDSATAGTLGAVLKPLLSVASLLMIVRIVMSWSPELDGKALPWSIAYKPTEPLLAATRKVVPPFNGLDVSPIVWVALLSFLAEILTGPQGILSLIARKGI